MTRTMYETNQSYKPDFRFRAGKGLVTVEDNGDDMVRFILERQTISGNCHFETDSDEMIPRAMLPMLLADCRKVKEETI